jgi:leukotriene-A4 hydrolase
LLTQDWPTQQKNVFLETLQGFSKKSLSHASDVFPVPFLELMDRTYKFGESKNAEIMLRWQTLCLESEAEWIVPSVVEFITSQGRMKFVRPLYRLLRDTAIGKQVAIDTFEANKSMYDKRYVFCMLIYPYCQSIPDWVVYTLHQAY